jgi:hypothetical protein
MIDYYELAALADRLLEISGDDEEQLATVLDTLDPSPRAELLVSDFLNAYQTFFYFFRTTPHALVREHLTLTPATDIRDGVLVEEIDLFQIVFFVRDGVPFIAVGDGKHLLATFQGKGAYQAAHRYIDELPSPA